MKLLAPCSKGSRMLTPMERSRPAPSMPAAIIPGPAPVTTIQSSDDTAPARSRADR